MKKITQEGFVTYEDACFFRECVAEYAGCELDPGGKVWGLEQNRLYKVYRPKSEVVKASFVLSCNAKPLRNDHPKEGGIGNTPGLERPGKEAGVLTEVRVVGNELHGRVDVWDPDVIKAIEHGKRELSLGYSCEFRKQSGEFNGEHYDFVQSGLKAGNHLALVDEARNGSQCRVVDCKHICDSKFQLEQPTMDWKTISADELVKGLGECSDECKAKAKEFLNTPTEDEKKAAEEAAKKAEEQKAKDEAEAKEKAEAEKKEAVDAAVEEQKKADEKECADKCETAAKDAVAEYKATLKLADDCKAVFGTIATDSIATRKELVGHICSMTVTDASVKAKIEKLKSMKPEVAIDALGILAPGGATKTTRVADSVVKPDVISVADYMKSR